MGSQYNIGVKFNTAGSFHELSGYQVTIRWLLGEATGAKYDTATMCAAKQPNNEHDQEREIK